MVNETAPPRSCGTDGPSAEVGVAPSDVRAAESVVAENGGMLTPRGGAHICTECGAAAGKPGRIPPGWKRDGELEVCGKCWRTRFVLRAVSIPVQADDALWNDLRAGWKVARRAANRYVRSLYLGDDFGSSASTAKLPRFPNDPALAQRQYHELRNYAPDYTTVSLCALMNWVRTSYLKRRFDLWIGRCSLPTYRSVPWIVRKTGWTTSDDGGEVTITCYQQRRTLRLSQSSDFARQRAFLARAASGALLRGDAKLCEQDRRIMFRAAVWIPIVQSTGLAGTLLVSSSKDALLMFTRDGRRALKPLHLRHLRSRIALHDEWRQTVADDTKHEKRWPSHVRRDMLAALERRCGRANDTLRTACQQIAAMIVGFAQRQKIAEIALDLMDRGYVAHFPWSELAANIGNAAELRGIRCAKPKTAV